MATNSPSATCWPNDLQRLLLSGALRGGDRAVRAARQWADQVDLDYIDYGSFRILPLLARTMEQLGVDLPIGHRIRGIYRRSWYRNQVLLQTAAAAIGTLAAAEIPMIVTKGAAVADRYYPDLGTRPMGDVDIVVPATDRDAAIDALTAAGWRGDIIETGLETRHGCPFHNDVQGNVDLHWATSSDLHPDFDESAAWNRTAVTGRLSPARRLAPEDELLLTIRHGLQEPGGLITWAADAALILRGASIDWPLLIEAVDRYQRSEMVGAALRLVADVADTPVPSRHLVAIDSLSHRRWHRNELNALTRPSRSLRLNQVRGSWYRYRRWSAAGNMRANPLRFPAHWAHVLGLRGPQALVAHTFRVVGRSLRPKANRRSR